jgi:hypothetical protein
MGLPGHERKAVFYGLLGVLALTTLLRLGLGWWFYGFWTGDDVEILQSGFARALGVDYEPFRIRHLLLPDLLLAPVLRMASAAGLESINGLVLIAKLPFVLLATLNIFLVFLLARSWIGRPYAALLASLIYGLHWLPLGYGSTVYPRTAATTCVLLAALLISHLDRGYWRPFIAGIALATAFAFRFSEVIFFAPCCALILLERPGLEHRVVKVGLRILALSTGLILGSIVLVGLEDWLTWGRPFSSLIHFARFTLIERASSSLVAEQPWYFYLWRLPKWLPPALLGFFVARCEWRRLSRPLFFVVLPLLILSAIHHKELRYLQGLMPFVAIAGATAASAWWQQGRRTVTAVLLGLSITWGLCGISFLSKTSMAAVNAARMLRSDPDLQRAALSQSWAYGEGLWLQHVEVRDLPVRPSVRDLNKTAIGCHAVCLYADTLNADPKLNIWLTANGFSRIRTFRKMRSRAVVLYKSPRRPSHNQIRSQRSGSGG